MANQRLNATITIGGTISGTLKSALGTTRSQIDAIGSSIKRLEREQRTLGSGIQTFGRLGRNVDGLRAKYATVTAELEKLRRTQERIANARLGMAAGRDQMASAGMALGAIGAAVGTAFVPVVQAARFEQALLGVAKQVDGTRDSAGRLTQTYWEMARQIQLLGREIPLATNEIAAMVASGARMGIAREELIQFTRTAAMMASAFDLPAEELADQMGKIAGLFKIPIPAMGELADAINYLDDNAIAKGGDIIEVLKRIGGVAAFVKMPAQEAAALASTFLTLGSNAEIAGTAANAVMRELSVATMQPKRFQQGLQAIGMLSEKIQKAMASNATGTILEVLDRLNTLPDEQRLTAATQLFGKEYGDDIAKLASGVGEYRRQLALAHGEAAKGSMGREFAAQLATTNAQWEIAKNRITEISVNLGQVLLPTLNAVLGTLGSATSSVADFVKAHEVLVGNAVAVAGAILGTVAAIKAFQLGIGATLVAFNALKLALLTNPFTLVATGAVAAAVLIYRNWDWLKAKAIGIWDTIRTTATSAWQAVSNAARTALEWVTDKIEAIGRAWQNFRNLLASARDWLSPSSYTPRLPEPPPALAPRGHVNQTVTNNNTFNITQQRGQPDKQLAYEIAERIRQRKAVESRSSQIDQVMAGAY